MKRTLKKIMAGVLAAALAVTSLSIPSIDSSAKYVAETALLGRQAAAEGIVMLENKENVLPLTQEKVISVFGRCQIDTFFCGYGSGSAPSEPYEKVSILEGIKKNPSIQYNEELAEIYSQWCKDNPASYGSWGNWPYYHEEMLVTDEIVQEARNASDVAVVVIGRAAGEDRECKLQAGSYYLTNDEKDLLSKVNQKFDKIVVMINAGNLIDMAWLENYENIKGILYVWQGGLEMGNAVADVLSGDMSPSGKLADTIAKTYEDYPASGVFANNDKNTSVEKYEEDIYVGYRYFETFAKDRVLYPFGYGLSYTTFDTDATVESDEKNITVKATVTNTGDTYSGKEVVEVYYGAPQGQLGKPARALAGYAKTNEIAPGASQTVEISFPIENMASYDDSGKTGHDSAWVLEAGDYDIYVGNSVRAAEKSGTYQVPELQVVEQLEEASAPHQAFDRILPVENGDGTFTESTEPVPTATEEADLAARVLAHLPEAVEQTEDQGIKLIDVYNSTNTMDEFIAQLSVEELAAISRGDWGKNSGLVPTAKQNASAFGGVLASLREKGVPAVSTHDGPAGPKVGVTGTGLPIGTMLACTWNDVLVEKLCYDSGCEMTGSQADVWLAPGMNIHRDPLGGRNFEYFSEDPLLTGQMGSSVTRGIQKAGVSVMPKHYAVNSQETNRYYSDSVVSERAQREIYLRGFEICVKTAKPYNVMASYNKINGEWSHYNYDTATTILRNDWGYEGTLHTDWWLRRDTSEELGGVADNAYRIRAQVDVNEPGEGPNTENGSAARTDTATIAAYQAWVDAGSPTDRLVGLTLGELQRTAKNVVNTVMHSRVFRATNGLENDYEPGTAWFNVEGVAEETKPLLDELTIEGMDFAAFDPSTMLYEVFWKDMSQEFPSVHAKASGAEVTVVQATAEVPAATVTVIKDGGKSVYRVIFTDRAGLIPVVENPVLAKVTGIQIDGKYLTTFYPTIYYYTAQGNAETSEIVADVPNGVDCRLIRKPENQEVILRAESNDQAVEYVLKFPNQRTPESDNFDDEMLDENIWKVMRPTSNLTESGGTLNIQTEGGEWYGTGADKNNINNVVYQEAGGNWEITVKLEIPKPADLIRKDTNQFGIAIFDDPDNYIDMNYVTPSWSGNGHMLQVRQETDGSCNDKVSNNYPDVKALPATEKWQEKESVALWVCVKREGSQYTILVKTEDMEKAGEDFTTLGIASAEFQEPKIGLYASKGNGNAATSLMKFDDFEVNDGRPQSDSFDGTALGSFWSVDNRTENMNVSDGSLNIQTESGEWYGSNEDSYPIRNMPYQNAKGNWTATVEILIPKPADLAGKDTNQFGITVFEDSDNYVDANYCTVSWSSNNQRLQARQETDGKCNDKLGASHSDITGLPMTENWKNKENVTLWLRVKKEGASYTFSALTEDMKEAGKDFALLGEAKAYFKNPKLGLYATLGKSAPTSLVHFKDFTITDYQAAPEEDEPAKAPVSVSKAGESRVMAVADAMVLTSELKAESCQDTETNGGQDLGYGNSGAYAIYAIQVQDEGYYKVSTRVASGIANEVAQLSHEIEVDGEVAGVYEHTTTGGWQNWIYTDAQNVYLPAGRHSIRFVYGAQINFNFIRFVPCTEEEADMQALTDAKAVIEGISAKQLRIEQTAANTVEEVQNWLAEKINMHLAQKESLRTYGVQVQPKDIMVNEESFQAAVEGTSGKPQGKDGAYSFTAALTLGESSIVTEVRSGSILATAYKGDDMVTESLKKLYGVWAAEDLSVYTKESVEALEKALAAAEAVLAAPDASRKELDKALGDLVKAIGGLEYGVQRLHLETAIEAAEKLLKSGKDYEDIEALTAAVEEGRRILADENASQEAVDQAAYAILDEMSRMAKAADLVSLEGLIEAAKGLLDGGYTSKSLENLKKAIQEAEAVVADQNRGDRDISDAYTNLIDAIIHLERKGDKAALKAMLEKAREVLADADAYVAETLEGLEDTVADAQKVYDNEDAQQSEVDEAVKALTMKVAEARLLGDVNGDGRITTADSAAVLRSAAELDTLSPEAAASADVNGDGAADTSDAVRILQYAAEKFAAF